MSVNTTREAKNRLKQLGLIDFNTPEKASKGIEGQTRYWFPTVSKNDTVSDTVKPRNKKPTVSNFDTDSCTVPGTVGCTVPDTNNKLNKTKPNNSDAIASGQADTSVKNLKKEKEKSSAKKEKEDATPFWAALVEKWFWFYQSKCSIKPSFQGQDSSALKTIMKNLQKRAQEQEVEWNEEKATNTLHAFLHHAYKDKWLSENFLLPNLLRQFDKIVSDATTGRKGTGQKSSVNDAMVSALQAINGNNCE